MCFSSLFYAAFLNINAGFLGDSVAYPPNVDRNTYRFDTKNSNLIRIHKFSIALHFVVFAMAAILTQIDVRKNCT